MTPHSRVGVGSPIGRIARRLAVPLLVAGFAVLSLSSVAAEEKSTRATVRSGVEGHVYFAAYFNTSTCRLTGLPSIVGLQSPGNGRVSIRKTQKLIEDPACECSGRYLTGVEVRYASKPKFVGQDEFLFDVVYPEGNYERVRASVEVTR